VAREAAKRGGQIATISTAGEPGGEFEETRERIRQTTPVVERRDGASFLRAVGRRGAARVGGPEDGDVEDMAVVKAANPFRG
jgi:general stress protein YciG